MEIKWNSRRKGSIKRLVCPLLAFTLAAGLIVAAPKLSGEARAVELDKNDCSLTIAPGPTSTEFADIDDANVVIDLYKVADAAPVSGYDTYTYNFKKGYEALAEAYEKSGERLDSKAWRSMAQAAASVALDDTKPVKPEKTGKANEKITGLNCGLYLLIARGDGLEDYKTTVTTEEQEQNIVTIANSEEHVYRFSPELISLPSRKGVDADGNVINTTAGNSPWVYDMEVTLKPEQRPRYGSLEIVKGLKTYNMSVPAVFVFQVEAVMPKTGENVYSNVVTMNFTEAGEQKTLIDKQIPVGAKVTVTEVYSGASYKITSDDEQTATIKATDIVSVSFENDHETTSHGGGGVNNHFYHDGTKWHWQKDPLVNDNDNK